MSGRRRKAVVSSYDRFCLISPTCLHGLPGARAGLSHLVRCIHDLPRSAPSGQEHLSRLQLMSSAPLLHGPAPGAPKLSITSQRHSTKIQKLNIPHSHHPLRTIHPISSSGLLNLRPHSHSQSSMPINNIYLVFSLQSPPLLFANLNSARSLILGTQWTFPFPSLRLFPPLIAVPAPPQ